MTTCTAPLLLPSAVAGQRRRPRDIVSGAPASERADLAEWGSVIAADGIAVHEDAVRDIVAAATRAEADPILIAVLADPGAAPVLRERALARLAPALAVALSSVARA